MSPRVKPPKRGRGFEKGNQLQDEQGNVVVGLYRHKQHGWYARDANNKIVYAGRNKTDDEVLRWFRKLERERSGHIDAATVQLPAALALQEVLTAACGGGEVVDIDTLSQLIEKEYTNTTHLLRPLIMGCWTDALKENEVRYLKWRHATKRDLYERPNGDDWNDWVDAKIAYDLDTSFEKDGVGTFSSVPASDDLQDYMLHLVGVWAQQNPSEAERKLNISHLEECIVEGVVRVSAPPLMLSKLCDEYKDRPYEDHVQQNKRNHKYFRNNMYKHQREFVDIVGEKRGDIAGARTTRDLTQQHFSWYYKEIHRQHKDGKYGPQWLIDRFRAVKAMIRHARKCGVDSEDVRTLKEYAEDLEMPDMNKPKPNAITPQQFQALLKACANDLEGVRMRALLLLAINCGLSTSEALQVTWTEVDLEAGVTDGTRYKGGSRRAAVLDEKTITALRRYKKKHHHKVTDEKGEELVFATDEGGSLEHKNGWLYPQWKTLLQKAGLPDSLEFKMIRKSTESTANANECHIGAAIILGHKLPGVSDHYTMRTPETARKASAAVMGGMLGSTSISMDPVATVVTSEGKRKTAKRA